MAVTVNDVARRAGVSPATVSRFLNKNAVVSPEASAAIQQAVTDLGYDRGATNRGRRPLGRAHAERRTGALGILIPDLRADDMLEPVNALILHGAESYARENGYTFVIARQDEQGLLSPSVTAGAIDGIIARSGTLNESAVPDQVLIVWVFRPRGQFGRGDMVYPDSEGIGRLALDYLLQRNRHQLAVVYTPSLDIEAGLRVDAFVAAAAVAGHTVKVKCCEPAEIPACTAALMEGRGRADGLYLPMGDDIQLAALRTITSAGRKLGKDVDVMGCNNDIRRLRLTYPGLPNIDVRAAEIGKIAAAMLETRLIRPGEQWRRTVVGARLDVQE